MEHPKPESNVNPQPPLEVSAAAPRRPVRWWLVAAGIAVGSAVLAALVVIGWYWWALQPINRSATDSQIISYKSGESVDQLAAELEQKQLIRSSTAFTAYATLTGKRRMLQAGSYEVKASQSTPQIVTMVADGKIAADQLLLTEGETIFDLKAKMVKLGMSEADVTKALAASYPNTVLAQRPPGSSLEGYLFPDTYTLQKPYDAQKIIQQLITNFETQLNDTDFVQKWAAQGLSTHQALTLASIVEREVRSDEDRALVAQLYLNRLKIGMMLQADPTAIYAAELAGRYNGSIDLKINSPYNTYLVKGLPPGPIGNPGLRSMAAVADPEPNDNLYFISGKDGTTYFAKTYEEHQKNIDRYLK